MGSAGQTMLRPCEACAYEAQRNATQNQRGGFVQNPSHASG